jgi:hypothetical protein
VVEAVALVAVVAVVVVVRAVGLTLMETPVRMVMAAAVVVLDGLTQRMVLLAALVLC